MFNVLLTGCLSFIVTFLAIPVIIRVATEKSLYDIPDARKLHTRPIASLGGVGMFIGLMLSLLLAGSAELGREFQYFFAAIIVTFFLGLKDDILIISATKKFLGQVAAAAILIHLAGIRIDSMHGLLGIYELPEVFSLALSYTAIIVITNAFNLIDGVDGLAGSLGLLTMSVFGAYFLAVGLPAYALLAFAVAGSLLAFLIFNFHPARIFMGDSGSLVVGLINAVLVLKFISVADSPGVAFPVDSAVAVGFSILIVPLLDTLRVFSIRIFRGRSPFSPDRNHIHHLLLDRGLNHRQVALGCVFLNVVFIATAYLGRSLGPTVLLSLQVLTSFLLIGMLFYLVKPVPRLVVATTPLPSKNGAHLSSATKVVVLKSEAAAAEQ